MTTAATTCAFHPNVETALSCTACGRPACIDCLTPAAVGQHCDGCTKGARRRGGRREGYRVKAAVIGVDERQRLRRPARCSTSSLRHSSGRASPARSSSRPSQGPRRRRRGSPPCSSCHRRRVVGLMLHEWAHAMVAYFGGERSVVEKGYLTMDVRHYSHPLLSIGMPIVFLLLGGLPLPGGAVWINRAHIRSKWWDSAVSLAGPAMKALWALHALRPHVDPRCSATTSSSIGALQFLAFIQIALVNPEPACRSRASTVSAVLEPHLRGWVQAALAPLRQGDVRAAPVLRDEPGERFHLGWRARVRAVPGDRLVARGRTARNLRRRALRANNRAIANACSLAGMPSSSSPAAGPNRWAILALLGVAQLMVVLDRRS